MESAATPEKVNPWSAYSDLLKAWAADSGYKSVTDHFILDTFGNVWLDPDSAEEKLDHLIEASFVPPHELAYSGRRQDSRALVDFSVFGRSLVKEVHGESEPRRAFREKVLEKNRESLDFLREIEPLLIDERTRAATLQQIDPKSALRAVYLIETFAESEEEKELAQRLKEVFVGQSNGPVSG
jgi:hypothetical protein